MRAWHVLVLITFTTGVAGPAIAHVPTLEECLEGGDFIAHAAQSRDNGMTKEQFMERLVADVRLIQSYPPPLRWFVADADDATFLSEEALRVFDARRSPDAHRAQFLSRCFDRSAQRESEEP
jgi:hypothetical protein